LLLIAAITGVAMRSSGNVEGSRWAFRLGLAGFFAAATVVFGMLFVLGGAMWFRRRAEVSTDALILVAGLALGCGSGLVLAAALPSVNGQISLPGALRLGFVASLALIIGSMVRPTLIGLRDALRRGDHAVLLALLAFIGVVLWGLLTSR
jgi:hypothetical protein